MKKILQASIVAGMLSSCFLFPEDERQSGIVVTGNTIAIDTQKVRVSYVSGKSDTGAFFGALRRASTVSKSETSMGLSSLAEGELAQLWDFDTMKDLSFPSMGKSENAASVIGNVQWSEMSSGTVFVDAKSLIQVPFDPVMSGDTIAIRTQVFPILNAGKKSVLLQDGNGEREYLSFDEQGYPVFRQKDKLGNMVELKSRVAVASKSWSVIEIRKIGKRLEMVVNGKLVGTAQAENSLEAFASGFIFGDSARSTSIDALVDFFAVRKNLKMMPDTVGFDTVSVVVGNAFSDLEDAEIGFLQSQVAGNSSGDNHDSWAWLSVGTYDPSTVCRSLVRFSLSDSLSRYKLVQANLVLQVNGWISKNVDDSATIAAHKILKPWKEGEVTAQNSSLGVNWNLVGLDTLGNDAGVEVSRGSHAYGDMANWEFDLTKTVAQWIAQPNSNYGVLLRDIGEMNSEIHGYPKFWSKNGDLARSPKLSLKLVKAIIK